MTAHELMCLPVLESLRDAYRQDTEARARGASTRGISQRIGALWIELREIESRLMVKPGTEWPIIREIATVRAELRKRRHHSAELP